MKQVLVSKNERPALCLDTNSQKINGLPVSSHSWPKLRNHASTTTKRHYKQPNIHKQILQTDLQYIYIQNELREFYKRSKHFSFGDYFIDSNFLYSLLSLKGLQIKGFTQNELSLTGNLCC